MAIDRRKFLGDAAHAVAARRKSCRLKLSAEGTKRRWRFEVGGKRVDVPANTEFIEMRGWGGGGDALRWVAGEVSWVRKWLIGWGIAGLVAPTVYIVIYAVAGYTLGEGIFVFWPGAVGLMALNDGPPLATVLFVWGACVLSNVILYAVIGILLRLLSRLG